MTQSREGFKYNSIYYYYYLFRIRPKFTVIKLCKKQKEEIPEDSKDNTKEVLKCC